jgi:hypothetical protein
VEATIVWMSNPVAAHLRTLGFSQRVPLDALPNKWWSIAVDVAALESNIEPGCGYRRTVASSEAIGAHHAMYWCEIAGGPFDRAEDADDLYLASPELDVDWLGSGATVVRISPWISNRLSARGAPEPVHLKTLAGMYWVCGLAGGVCSTEELAGRLRRNQGSTRITHGPYEDEADAHCAFDVMWESPE